jgi:hypothetical protein
MTTKRRVLAAKIEAVEGTPEALTAAETGVIVIDPKYSPDVKMIQRLGILASFSKLPDLPGPRLAHISFRAEVYGRAAAFAADNLPALSPYFRACGLAETLDVTPGSEKVSYTRASSGIPSLTLGLYTDGLCKMISGARGTVKFSAEVGGALYADFDFLGVYQPPVDAAMLVPSYVNLVPPQLLAAAFQVDAFAPVLKSFSIDLGNKLAGREDLNSASGYKSFLLVDGDTRGTFDPEQVLVATHDYYGNWGGGIHGALSVGPFNAVQYNRLKITAPKLVTTKVDEGEREGQAVHTVGFQLAMDAGDDEVVIEIS